MRLTVKAGAPSMMRGGDGLSGTVPDMELHRIGLALRRGKWG